MPNAGFADLASVFGKQPDHVWSAGKLAVGGYKVYGGKTTFLATSGARGLVGFELALQLDERFNVKAHGPVAERLLALVSAHGKALAKGRPKKKNEAARWSVAVPHPGNPGQSTIELVAGDLIADVKGLEVVVVERPAKPATKPTAPVVNAKALARSAGVTLTPALAAIWKLPTGTVFESYDVLDPSSGVERALSLRKLVASKSFKAKTRDREYFDDNGRVRPVHFDTGWIPFAVDSGGNLLCLDTNPGPKGRANQIIQWEIRGGGAFVRGPSLTGFRKSLR